MTDMAHGIDNLSKRYRTGAAKMRHDTLRDAASDIALSISRAPALGRLGGFGGRLASFAFRNSQSEISRHHLSPRRCFL